MKNLINLIIWFTGAIVLSQNPEVAPCSQSNQRIDYNTSLGINLSQLIAADINVPGGEMFSLSTIEVNFDIANGNAGIASADIIIRSALPNTIPGDEIFSEIEAVPISQVFLETTSNDSSIYLITFELTTPVILSGTQTGAKYWVQLEGNPINAGTYVGWETTDENILGSGFAININGNWAIVSTNDMIYTFIGDCDILSSPDNSIEDRGFEIYPNPSNNEFSLLNVGNFNEETIQINMYDIYGKRVKSQKYQSTPFDISELNSGIYIVSILNGKAITNLKLIKK